MQLNVTVCSERPNEYDGKKGHVKQIILSCLDTDKSQDCFINLFDFVLSDAEKEKYAGKLTGKTITLGIQNFETFNGRLRSKGRIIEPVK